MLFDLDLSERKQLYNHVIRLLEDYYHHPESVRVSPAIDLQEVIQHVRAKDFNHLDSPKHSLEFIVDALNKMAVHTPHPHYYGLFNPRSNFAGILADLITGVFNPQMAAWSHSPFAVEVENYLIQTFGEKFGIGKADGVFAGGGAEANLTATLCALNHKFPTFGTSGLQGLDSKPVMYCSVESHHSVARSAMCVGLGLNAVRNIPVNDQLQMDIPSLQDQILKDIEKGFSPFMVIGTAGTTGQGAIDDLGAVSQLAQKYKLWFHTDAAYGGAAIISPNLSPLLTGIEHSDSITFDAHKWLSVPMATSMLITGHEEILSKTFRITAEYMPKDASDLPITDPFTHSIQWSRRFIGLRVYLSLLFYGWEGYRSTIDHQSTMGDLLKKELKRNDWSILNHSDLPIVCFTDEVLHQQPHFDRWVVSEIVKSGKAWISTYPIGGKNTIRACITNYATDEMHIHELVALLNQQRTAFRQSQFDQL